MEARALPRWLWGVLDVRRRRARLQLVAFVPRVRAVEVLDCDFRIRTQTPTDTSSLQTQSAS